MRRPLYLLAVLVFAARAQADLTRVFPNGGRRGTTLTLTLGGKELPETADLFVEGDGIKPLGPFVKGVGRVEIAADAPPGVRQLRLVGPRSATHPRPFIVGTLPEIAEREPNDNPGQAQRIEALPVTINGVLPTRTDMDLFRVTLKKGECLVAAGESRALGAPTNLVLRIRDAAGRELLVQMDYRTRDPLIAFTAPADGDYLVELQEVMNNYSSVNEDYVYRLTLTTGPWIDTVSPPGARRGASARLTFSGWNLGGQAGPSRLEAEVAVPPDAGPRYLVSAGGAPNQVPLSISSSIDSAPEIEETEPNGPSAPQLLTLPVTVNGTFAERGDLDCYQFAARSGEKLLIRVEARDLGSFADPVLTLLDAAGKTLAAVDDVEGSRDPRLFWAAPADGIYTLHLRDVAAGSRGGPGFFYRLTLAPPMPVLRLTTPMPTPVLKQGASLEIPITVSRSFVPEAVSIEAEGLPAGVTAGPLTLAADPGGALSTEAKLVLTAAANAPPGSAAIRIVARVGKQAPVRATATWVLATDRSGTLAQGSTERLLLLIPPP